MVTVSDFIIDRLIEWDLHRFYGFPGDGIGGLRRRPGTSRAGRQGLPLSPPGPRGDRGVDGVRARQVHRRGGCVHGDLGSGRGPHHERALRRLLRQPAGRGHRRSTSPSGHGQRLPTGAQHGAPVRGRGRVRQDGDGADAGSDGARSSGADRPGVPQAHRRDPSGRRPGSRDGGTDARALGVENRGRARLDEDRATRGGAAACRRGPQRRQQGGHDRR